MPKTRENLIHLYWDKAVLLILAAVGIYVFLGRVISSPIEAGSTAGPKQTPKQLVEDLYRQSDALKEKMERSNPPEPNPSDYIGVIRKRFSGALPNDLPRNALTRQGPGVEETRLAKMATPPVLAPLKVRGHAGIGLIAPDSGTSRSTTQPASSVSGTETYWITVAAEFPFYRQYLAFAGLDPLVDEGRRLSEKDQRFVFARVDMQRQELMPDDSWSEAEDINPYELYRQKLPNTVKNLTELYSLSSDEEPSGNVNVLKSWLSRAGFQEFVVRPEFFTLAGFEQWYWPEEPLPDLADDRSSVSILAGELPKRDDAPKYRAVRNVTQDRLQVEPTRPNVAMDPLALPGGGLMGPDMFPGQPVMDSSVRSGSISAGRERIDRGRRVQIPRDYRQAETIRMWAHDSSVVPGRTYRYRMRVLLFNPLCGDERAENSKVRTLAWLEGPWSDWSEPAQTLQKRVPYFTGVSPARGSKPPRAKVTVYAWQNGWWYEHLFFYSDAGSIVGDSVDVPHFVFGDGPVSARSTDLPRAGFGGAPDLRRPTSARRDTKPDGPGPRPKVTVDFTTDWSIVDFTSEVQFNQPVDKESTAFEAVSTAELVVMEQETKRLVKRYVVIDGDDLRRKELEQIVARQEAAFRDMQRQLRQLDRQTTGPRAAPRPPTRSDSGFPGLRLRP